MVTKLEEEMGRCRKELEEWNICMGALKTEDGKWVKNAVKRVKLAADSGRFGEMRVKIAGHRGQLGLLIELLTVYEMLFGLFS